MHNSIRKFLSILLAAALLLSLTGCAGKGNGTLSQEEDTAKLYKILDDIAANVRPGSAGNGLTSVRIAADLVSWAASSNMSKKEAAEAMAKWYKDQPQEVKDAYKEQLQQVAEAYAKIALDGAKDMLESAGVKGTFNNLSDKLKETVEAILASGGVN